GATGAGSGFWTAMPGSPTRVSDTQFTITDTGNANKYDKLFCKGTVLTWNEGGTWQTGMVISAAYDSNTVTIDIVGDSLTAGFDTMKYAAQLAMRETFAIPGSQATGTDVTRQWVAPFALYKLSLDAIVDTAGTTNATTYDVNDDGSSLGANPSIASGETTDFNNGITPAVVASGSIITVDIDAASTTQAIDGYIVFWYYPESWRYRSGP
ncbi:MAG: hypothetical protein PHU71_05160, partial [Candidatus Gracilibacteria bacterium]|nr:hypothetical protein [Candidatus Gracilibacteria bacterium]